jgi:hypothetical protein
MFLVSINRYDAALPEQVRLLFKVSFVSNQKCAYSIYFLRRSHILEIHFQLVEQVCVTPLECYMLNNTFSSKAEST